MYCFKMKSFPIYIVYCLVFLRDLQINKSIFVKSASRSARRRSDIEDFSSLVNKGEAAVQYHENQDVILFLGNVGSGKSTLTLFLAGDNAKLRAYRDRTGQIKISDEDNKISSSSRNEKTIFPELYDDEIGRIFYDCPGFNIADPINSIAANYYLKEIIRKSKNVKLILTVEESVVVNDSSESEEFLIFLDNACQFLIHNIDGYEDSISLVVTKVANEYKIENGQRILIEDEIVVRIFSERLNSILAILRENGSTFSCQNNSCCIKLLNILTKETHGLVKNIGIFRKPDSLGRLNEISILQERKVSLYDLIDGLKYTTINDKDFGFSIDDNALSKIEALRPNILRIINSNMTYIFKQIQEYNNIKLQESNDIFNLLERNIIPNLNSLKNCIEFDNFTLENVLECIARYQPEIYILSDAFTTVAESLDYLKILNTIAPNLSTDDDMIFLVKLQLMISETLADFTSWHEIYQSMYEELSSYYRQERTTRTALNNLLPNQLDENFEITLELLNITDKTIINKDIDESRLIVFNKLVNLLQNYSLEYQCSDDLNILKIRGIFLELSELDYTQCPNAREVELFGLLKIFIDEIPDVFSSKNVSLISPILENVNTNVFNIITNIPKGLKFWALGRSNYSGHFGNFQLISKSCPRQDPDCYDGKLSKSFIEYESFVRKNIQNSVLKSYHLEFYRQLSRRKWANIEVYDTSSLILKLYYLEMEYNEMKNQNHNIDFLPLYELLLQNVLDYSKRPKHNENTAEYKYALKIAYTAILSKICNIKNGRENALVIDISKYINLAIENVEEYKKNLEQADIRKKIASYKNIYDKDLQVKIDEAMRFIETYIYDDLDKLNKEMDESISNILAEISHLEYNLQADQTYIDQKYDELREIMINKAFFNVFSILGKLCFFIPVVGPIITAAVDGGVAVMSSLSPQDIEFNRPLTDLPPGVAYLLNNADEKFMMIENDTISELRLKVEIAMREIENQEDYTEAYTKFSNIRMQLRRIKYGRDSSTQIDDLEKEYRLELDKLKSTRVSRSVRRITKKQQAAMVKKIRASTAVATTFGDTFSQIKSDSDKLETLQRLYEETGVKLQKVSQYKEQIINRMSPLLRNIKNYIMDLRDDLPTQSEVATMVSKWEMQRIMKEVKLDLQSMTAGLMASDDLGHCIEKLMDSLTLMMDICVRIQQYEDDRKLGALITNIQLSSLENSFSFNDLKLEKAVDLVSNITNMNVIQAQYERSINAVKQYIFPFAEQFLKEFYLPDELKPNGSQLLSEEILKQLKALDRRIKESSATIVKNVDSYIHDTSFYSNFTSSKPFYVWSDRNYRSVIANLLRGEEVVLKSNILKGPGDKNAVKFNLIGISFKTKNKAIQDELDEVLNNYRVNLTHLGNSYYKCDDKYYLIKSESQEIVYSFEKDFDGTPLDKNMVYTKISNGNLMLSPYATWKIKLSEKEDGGFENLEKFIYKVNLELQGHGKYVSKHSDVCSSNLDKYYQLVNPVYESVNLGLF